MLVMFTQYDWTGLAGVETSGEVHYQEVWDSLRGVRFLAGTK